MRNREKHGLSPTAANEPEQQSRHCIENNGLTGNEQEGDYRIKNTMLRFEPIQPVAQKMQDQEKICGDQDRIDGQLNCKDAQVLGTILFHEEDVEGSNVKALRALTRSVL
jgi:hypothetical protein